MRSECKKREVAEVQQIGVEEKQHVGDGLQQRVEHVEVHDVGKHLRAPRARRRDEYIFVFESSKFGALK